MSEKDRSDLSVMWNVSSFPLLTVSLSNLPPAILLRKHVHGRANQEPSLLYEREEAGQQGAQRIAP